MQMPIPGLSDNMRISDVKNYKMVMQVNQYVPHYQRIPTKLERKDLKLFQEDYTGNEQLQKIQGHIVNFDKVILEAFLGDREKRYKKIFYDEDTQDYE